MSLKGTDLSAVRAELLGKLLNKLETVNLRNCNLQFEQLWNIFQAVKDGASNLKKLDVFGNDLAMLDPEFIASAVCKLEKVALQENYHTFFWNLMESSIGYAIEELMDTSEDMKLKSLELDVSWVGMLPLPL